MNIKEFSNLNRKEMITEYSNLYNYTIKLFAENAVMKAKMEEQQEMNKLLMNKIRVLKKY